MKKGSGGSQVYKLDIFSLALLAKNMRRAHSRILIPLRARGGSSGASTLFLAKYTVKYY